MFGRKAYHGNMEENLRQIGAKIDELMAKGYEKSADAKVEYEKTMKVLKVKQAEASKKLKEVSEASDEAWEHIKKGADTAVHELKSAWESARSKFK